MSEIRHRVGINAPASKVYDAIAKEGHSGPTIAKVSTAIARCVVAVSGRLPSRIRNSRSVSGIRPAMDGALIVPSTAPSRMTQTATL